MTWQPIYTAPKDQDVLVWYDHDADPYQDPENPDRLTDYAAWCEGGDFLSGRGFAIAKWFPQEWESTDEYGNGYWLPAAWFSRGDFEDYTSACNALFWQPLFAPSEVQP